MQTHPMRTLGVSGCSNCIVLQPCGGHHLPIIRSLGCVNYTNNTAPVNTDDMNPLFQEKFWKLWDDVDGLQDYTIGRLLSINSASLPPYLPQLQHRHLKCSRLLDVPIIALKLFDVLGKRPDGGYAPKYSTASALRAAYKLRPDSHILLVGVDDDAPIENFWAEHRISGVCEALAKLDLLGVTVPNFSHFTCVPRFQILRNRKRILLSAERLSNAGVKVSPHLHGITNKDWDFWFGFLKEHSEVTVVTMEFQTGARADSEVGRKDFEQLLECQNRLGRPLHPLLVGAARFYKEAKQGFRSFTIIDSQPFMQAINRQILTTDSSGRFFWKVSPKSKDAPLEELIETNILYYLDKLNGVSSEELGYQTQNPNQAELDWLTSTPYLTAQPVA